MRQVIAHCTALLQVAHWTTILQVATLHISAFHHFTAPLQSNIALLCTFASCNISLHYCRLQHCTSSHFTALLDCTISVHYCKLHYFTIWGRQERQSSCRQQSGCSLPLSHSLSRDEDEDEDNEIKQTNKKEEEKRQTNNLVAPSSLTLSFS